MYLKFGHCENKNEAFISVAVSVRKFNFHVSDSYKNFTKSVRIGGRCLPCLPFRVESVVL